MIVTASCWSCRSKRRILMSSISPHGFLCLLFYIIYIVSSNGMVCGEGPDMVNALVANRLSPVPSLTVLCIGLCDRGTMSA